MQTGYQIYFKRPGENVYHACGLNNWFWEEKDAVERAKILNRDWKKYNPEYDYIIVKLG